MQYLGLLMARHTSDSRSIYSDRVRNATYARTTYSPGSVGRIESGKVPGPPSLPSHSIEILKE